jgi:hypothetical protein
LDIYRLLSGMKSNCNMILTLPLRYSSIKAWYSCNLAIPSTTASISPLVSLAHGFPTGSPLSSSARIAIAFSLF